MDLASAAAVRDEQCTETGKRCPNLKPSQIVTDADRKGQLLQPVPAARLRLPPDLPSRQRDFVCHHSQGVGPHRTNRKRRTVQGFQTLAAAKGPETV